MHVEDVLYASADWHDTFALLLINEPSTQPLRVPADE